MEYKTADLDNFRNLWFLDKYLVKTNGFVAGGCFKNILNGEKVKDFDIFFRNREDYTQAVNLYTGYAKDDKLPWREAYKNAKVHAFYNDNTGMRVELNKSVFGEPKEVLDAFDFTITQFAYYSQPAIKEELPEADLTLDDLREALDSMNLEFKVMYHPDFFEHLQQKRLVISNLPFPVSTFERSLRYTKYGYSLCRDSKVKLLSAINDLQKISDKTLSASLYDGRD